MSNETKKPDYPAWFLEWAQDVLDMRDAQRDYFKGPNDYKMKVAKAKEAKADKILERFLSAGYISHKQKPSDNQLTFFK